MSGDFETRPTPSDREWARAELYAATNGLDGDQALCVGRGVALGVSQAALVRADADNEADAALIRRARALNDLLWGDR